MRFLVLLFGLIAVTATAAAALGFFMFDVAFVMVEDWAQQVGVVVNEDYTKLTKYSHSDTAIFLGMAAAYGFLGVCLSFFRCGWQGALLLIFPALTAGLFNPASLVFTSFQILVGLMSFLVFPLPLPAPAPALKSAKRRSNDDDDDDD